VDRARGALLAARKVLVHRAVKLVAASRVKEVGKTKLFQAEVGWWHLLWFALAVSTAWRLAMRTSSTERMRTVEEDQSARLEADQTMRQELGRRAREPAGATRSDHPSSPASPSQPRLPWGPRDTSSTTWQLDTIGGVPYFRPRDGP
jgi:hypothetical protein